MPRDKANVPNIRRREQLAVYKRTTKMLVDNGFRDLVISCD